MDKELLGNLKTYSEVYEYVSKETRTKEELFRYLQERGKARSTADEQVKKIFANQIQLLITEGEEVSLNSTQAYDFVSELCECFGLKVVCSPNTPKPEDVIYSLQKENDALKRELKRLTEKPAADAIIHFMENATISLEGMSLYTADHQWQPYILNGPEQKVEVEKVLSVQGGERDSLYHIINDYEKEMTVDNYVAKQAGKAFSRNHLEGLVYALTHLEKIEKGKKKRKEIVTHDELMEERVRYINHFR